MSSQGLVAGTYHPLVDAALVLENVQLAAVVRYGKHYLTVEFDSKYEQERFAAVATPVMVAFALEEGSAPRTQLVLVGVMLEQLA